jgi:hypothetical protein
MLWKMGIEILVKPACKKKSFPIVHIHNSHTAAKFLSTTVCFVSGGFCYLIVTDMIPLTAQNGGLPTV